MNANTLTEEYQVGQAESMIRKIMNDAQGDASEEQRKSGRFNTVQIMLLTKDISSYNSLSKAII